VSKDGRGSFSLIFKHQAPSGNGWGFLFSLTLPAIPVPPRSPVLLLRQRSIAARTAIRQRSTLLLMLLMLVLSSISTVLQHILSSISTVLLVLVLMLNSMLPVLPVLLVLVLSIC